jgi:rRNA-processing protein FCF1
MKEILGVDDGTALVLYANGYRTMEDIADMPEDEFVKLPGMNKKQLTEIHNNAVKAKESGIVTSDVIAKIVEVAEAAKREAEKAAAVESAKRMEELKSSETAETAKKEAEENK